MMNNKIKNEKKPGYAAPAVIRAFKILNKMADSGTPLSLSDLSREMDCSKGTMHGLLKALVQVNALKKKGSRFIMGPVLAELTLRDWNFLKLSEQVKPHLESLRDKTGETVFLGVQGKSMSTIMAIAESKNPLNISAPVGTEIPLDAGAVGKVCLSGMDDLEIAAYIEQKGLTRFTDKSIIDPLRYMVEINLVREKGYAFDNEEYLPGVRAIAAPLNNSHGLAMVVWIAGFATSFGNDVMDTKIHSVLKASAGLREIIDI